MRKTFAIFAVGTLVATSLAVTSAPANALSEGLTFTAKDQPTWQTNGTVWALASANNTVFAGGTFSSISPPTGQTGTPRAVTSITSFNASTGAPGSCQPTLYSSTGTTTVRALDVSPDNKTLYIGGHFTSIDGVSVARLAAVDIATCKVTSFNPGSISSTVRAIDATADTLYFGGDFNTVRGETRSKFAAVNARTGALLPWTANADQPGRAVAVSKDGNAVAVGGDFFAINGQDAHSMAVVDAVDGTLKKTFGSGNDVTTQIPATSVTKVIISDDSGFYAGNEGTGGGVFDGKLALDNGTYAQRWRDRCLGANQALAVTGTTLYSANHAHDCALMGWQTDGRRVYLQAQTTQSPTESIAWKPDLNDGIGEGIGPRALTIAKNGSTSYLWAGGEFTLANGKAQRGLTRFASSGSSAAPGTPSRVTAEALETGKIQVRWRTSLDNDDDTLTYKVYRNGSATPIGTVEASSVWWNQPQAQFVDKNVTPGNTYTYRVTASDGDTTTSLSATASVKAVSSNVPYASTVVADGADLYWRYSETADNSGADSSSGNNLLRYMDSPQLGAAENAVAGEPGKSIGFNGTSYALNGALAEGPTTYSIETWVKTSSNRGGKIIGYGNGLPRTDNNSRRNSSSYDRQIYMTNDGRLIFGTYTNSAVVVTSSTSYNDDAWHHVVATQGSNGMRLYVDGVLVGKNGNTAAQSYQGSWRVGGDNLSGWPNRPSSDFFTGLLDETAVYPKVLTPAQVANHYAAAGGEVEVPQAPADAYGKSVFEMNPDFYWRMDTLSGTAAADSGIFGDPGVVSGTVGQTSGDVHGKAANLNDDGYISSSQQYSAPSTYSAELWFSTSAATGGRLIGFSSNQTGNSSNYDRHVYMRDDGRLIFGTWTGQENTITTDDAFNDGSWHHLVAVQSSAGMQLYIDGTLRGTNPQTAAQAYNGYWRVGGDNIWSGASGKFVQGLKIDEAAVYSSALGSADVATHFALGTGTTPPDSSAPTKPGALKATSNGNDVTLEWNASTDDTGVLNYTVHRSATENDAPDAANKIATVTATGYADTVPQAGTWYYTVVANDAAGNKSTPATTTVTITAPDVEAPSIPAGLTATVVDQDVKLSWTASTDNVKVAGYRVYRSNSATFNVSATTLISEPTSPSYTDKAVAEGDWYYRVVAVDSASNASNQSPVVAAHVEAPVVVVEPKTVNLPSIEDTMVNQSAANTNSGTSNQLASRGTPGYVSYMKFEMPQTPAGMKLGEASLRIRTTTSAIASSADQHQVRIADSNWVENTATWNNRPASGTAELGVLPAGAKVNSTYNIPLDLAVLGAAGSGKLTMAVASKGSDNMWFWSREHSSASYRPQLTVTFVASKP